MIQAFASWSHVVDHIWKLNLQAALLAVVVAVVCLLGRRRLSPGWRSTLWLLVFVRLVIPFGPSSTVSLGNVVGAAFMTGSRDVNGDTNTIATTFPNHETTLVRPKISIENGSHVLAPN